MKRIRIVGLAHTDFLIVGCQQNEPKEEAAQPEDEIKYEDYVFTKYELDVIDKVKIGEENAENSFVLAFDYSCPWCHKWMDEMLPVLQEKYIDTGKANYVRQPLVLLDQRSLLLSHVDYYLEKNQPEKLYDFQLRMAKEANNERWGTEEYVQETLKDYGIEMSMEELEENNPDPISLSRHYTKNLGVEFVPTLYVNGIKVYNAFNSEEIDKF